MGEIEKFIIMEDDIPRDGGRYRNMHAFLASVLCRGLPGYVKSFHVEKLLFSGA